MYLTDQDRMMDSVGHIRGFVIREILSRDRHRQERAVRLARRYSLAAMYLNKFHGVRAAYEPSVALTELWHVAHALCYQIEHQRLGYAR